MLKRMLFNFWIYILTVIKDKVDRYIVEDNEMYVVYFSVLNNDIYICKSGKYALELYNQLNKINMLTNRPHVKILYGPVNTVFKYKMAKLMDIVFTWDTDDAERRKVYSMIADVPIQK